jgi:hypothetical protein
VLTKELISWALEIKEMYKKMYGEGTDEERLRDTRPS